MDEDEEVDRQGGGPKMSVHVKLFLLFCNTHLQPLTLSFFSNPDNMFALPCAIW